MKVKKLGIEWGPAFEEASPIEVSHNDTKFEVYVNSANNLVLELPTDSTIIWQDDGFEVTIKEY